LLDVKGTPCVHTDTSTNEAGNDRADTVASLARRRLLAAGLGGAALSLLPSLARRASASTPPSSTGAGAGPGEASPGDSTGGSSPDVSTAPTTSAPPQRPTDADVPLLDFAESIELSARALYDLTLKLTTWTPDQAVVIGTIREGHSAYANSLSGMLGRLADLAPDAGVLDQYATAFSGPAAQVLDAAYTLESALVATHLDILGQLEGTSAGALLGSIVNIEARNSTVVAQMNGATDLDVLLVVDEADAFSRSGG
jgi:Ferritin-like domain